MNVTGTQIDARSQTHINSSITVTSIALHRIITVLYCIACTSSRERHISQKYNLGLKLSHLLCALLLLAHVLWLSCSITWASHMSNCCSSFVDTYYESLKCQTEISECWCNNKWAEEHGWASCLRPSLLLWWQQCMSSGLSRKLRMGVEGWQEFLYS